mmetsp:Transcript_1183/g.2643  ORF Transcript_1183/g.2643 Transcript_1183/m.2643 type:complete len:92 (+) Transcript_1183:71-346(+)
MSMSYVPEFGLHFPHTYVTPKKNGDGEYEDPKKSLVNKCLSSCSGWVNEYNMCVQRVQTRTDGKGTCIWQYEELGMCTDHCVAHDIFSYVK